MSTQATHQTVIIGAGISGLTLAYELQRRGQAYRLLEATDQPGGYIRSVRSGAYLRELGPNSLLGDDALLGWLDGLGLTPALTFSKPVSKARFIFRDGQYRPLPSGPLSLLLGNFFSWRTKWAIVQELRKPAHVVEQRSDASNVVDGNVSPGETLGQFFRRLFTAEVVDYAVGPFVAGIYAGDPEQLLVSETFPTLLTYEQTYGSVLRGFIKNQGATARRQSFSFQDGMQTLPLALADRLTGLSLNEPVRQIRRENGLWHVVTDATTFVAGQLVLAVGADAAARLLEPHYAHVAAALRSVDYPPMTAVHSVYKRADVAHPLNGFGGLNPAREERFCAGHIWSSSVFAGRCPADEVLFTTFVGGSTARANAQQPDAVIVDRVHAELASAFGIRAAAPVQRHLTRWPRAIPQYDAHLLTLKRLIPALEADGLFVCANWYAGVSLADCIQKGQKLAERLAV